MFYENELQLLRKTLNKCHIDTRLVDPNEPTGSWLSDSALRVFPVAEINRSLYEIFPVIRGNTIYRLTDLFLCRYLIMELPLCEKPTVLVIGPYLGVNITHEMALEQAERIGATPQQSRDVEMFYSTLSVVKEENFLYAAVTSFADYIWNGEKNYQFADLDLAISTLQANITDNKPVYNDAVDITLMEKRYEYENELMDAVAQGNVQKAEMMVTGFSEVSFENRVSDRLRNLKNYCIVTNTLMRKAAERGGVHPVHLDKVSSGFACSIEQLRSTEEAGKFVRTMMQVYCRLVKRHSMKDISPLVQKAMVYIENDLTCDLSLETVANMNNVNPGYLSSLFKKESGQSFVVYVNGRRIHRAKYLLRTTKLQVQTIAQHCGILDLHYFCRMFKKATGATPTEYRNKHIYD